MREAIDIQLRNSHCDTVTKPNNGANPQFIVYYCYCDDKKYKL